MRAYSESRQQAYYDVRSALARTYSDMADAKRVAEDCGLDRGAIAVTGAPINWWAQILRDLAQTDKLDRLRKVLQDENDHLVPLMDTLVTEGFPFESAELIDFRTLSIEDDVSQQGAVAQSLGVTQQLPAVWLTLSSASTPREITEPFVAGATATATMRLNEARARWTVQKSALENKRARAEAELNKLRNRIDGIELARKPTEPPKPTFPTEQYISDFHRQQAQQAREYASKQYDRAMIAYNEALGTYNANWSALPSLKEEAEGAKYILSDVLSEIQTKQADANGEQSRLNGEVEMARERDVLDGMRRVFRSVDDALDSQNNRTKGFLTLMVVARLFEKVRESTSQPAAAADLDANFDEAIDGLEQAVRQHGAEIAKDFIKASIEVARLYESGRRQLASLTQALAAAPASELQRRIDDMRQALDVVLPAVPSIGHLELPSQIDALAGELAKDRDNITKQNAKLKDLIDLQHDAVGLAVAQVVANAQSMLDRHGSAAELGRPLILRTRQALDLLRSAITIPGLPDSVRVWSDALAAAVVQRQGAASQKIIDDAYTTDFVYTTAKSVLDQHPIRAYSTDLQKLPTRLLDGETRYEDLGQIAESLSSRTDEVAQDYRQQMFTLQWFAFLPVIGVFALFSASNILSRVRPLVQSGHASYTGLARGVVVMTLRSAAAAVVTASLIVVAAIHWATDAQLLALLMAPAGISLFSALGYSWLAWQASRIHVN